MTRRCRRGPRRRSARSSPGSPRDHGYGPPRRSAGRHARRPRRRSPRGARPRGSRTRSRRPRAGRSAASWAPESRSGAAATRPRCRAVERATGYVSRRGDDAADVPAQRGPVPGRQRAPHRVRGPLPRAGPPPAARGPRGAVLRVGRHPRGLRGRRARRAVAVPDRLPGQDDRRRGPRRRHLQPGGGRPRAHLPRAPRRHRHLPGGPGRGPAGVPRSGRPGGRRAGPGHVHRLPHAAHGVPRRPVPLPAPPGPGVPLLDPRGRRPAPAAGAAGAAGGGGRGASA